MPDCRDSDTDWAQCSRQQGCPPFLIVVVVDVVDDDEQQQLYQQNPVAHSDVLSGRQLLKL